MQWLTIQREIKTEHCYYWDYGFFHRPLFIDPYSLSSNKKSVSRAAAWRHFWKGRWKCSRIKFSGWVESPMLIIVARWLLKYQVWPSRIEAIGTLTIEALIIIYVIWSYIVSVADYSSQCYSMRKKNSFQKFARVLFCTLNSVRK